MTRHLPRLTYRKLSILLHLEAGHDYQEIGAALGIHPATVRAHIMAIADKLPGNSSARDRVLLYCDRLLVAHADMLTGLETLTNGLRARRNLSPVITSAKGA